MKIFNVIIFLLCLSFNTMFAQDSIYDQIKQFELEIVQNNTDTEGVTLILQANNVIGSTPQARTVRKEKTVYLVSNYPQYAALVREKRKHTTTSINGQILSLDSN